MCRAMHRRRMRDALAMDGLWAGRCYATLDFLGLPSLLKDEITKESQRREKGKRLYEPVDKDICRSMRVLLSSEVDIPPKATRLKVYRIEDLVKIVSYLKAKRTVSDDEMLEAIEAFKNKKITREIFTETLSRYPQGKRTDILALPACAHHHWLKNTRAANPLLCRC